MTARQIVAASAVLAGLICAAPASALTFSGSLADSGNAALVGSDLGAASFTDELAVANNVAIYDLSVTTAGTVTIQSSGFAAGGLDPYFTLFKGVGGAATFLASNYDQAYSTRGDFAYSGSLAAGNYTVALGTFANMSFAENLGTGTLSDGFIGLGEAGSLGNNTYRLDVTTPVPEPAAWALCLAAGAFLWLRTMPRNPFRLG